MAHVSPADRHRSPAGARVRPTSHTASAIYLSAAGLLLCLGTLGCRQPSASAAATASKVSLAGSWAGIMPPSRDGQTLVDVADRPDFIWARVDTTQAPDGTLAGSFTLCAGGKTAEAQAFHGAKPGGPAVPLLSPDSQQPNNTIALSGPAGASLLHTVLRSQTEGAIFAGDLKKVPQTTLDRRCSNQAP